jgi:hypothetical protein
MARGISIIIAFRGHGHVPNLDHPVVTTGDKNAKAKAEAPDVAGVAPELTINLRGSISSPEPPQQHLRCFAAAAGAQGGVGGGLGRWSLVGFWFGGGFF